MLGFLMKRRFVNEVNAIASVCYDEAVQGKPTIDGFTLAKSEYLARLDDWMKKEEAHLDTQGYDGIVAVGDAVNRARVWVGIFLVRGALTHGAPGVPSEFIKKFYMPASYISDAYFNNLRAHSSEPFSSAVRNKMEEALERASA